MHQKDAITAQLQLAIENCATSKKIKIIEYVRNQTTAIMPLVETVLKTEPQIRV